MSSYFNDTANDVLVRQSDPSVPEVIEGFFLNFTYSANPFSKEFLFSFV